VRFPGIGSDGARVGRNSGLLLGDRVVRLGVGLFVNAWLVRYLGPERMGLMSFAQSLVLIAAVASQLGLETIVVRDLVRRPEERDRLLGTALLLRLAGSLVTLGAALGAVALLRPGDVEARTLTLVFTLIAFSQSFDVVDFWFQSRADIPPVVLARGAAFALGVLGKIAVIVLHAPLWVVALVLAGEFALSAVALLAAYALRGRSPLAWRWAGAQATTLLRDCWPLIVNGMAIVVSVRVDQMLITTLRGTYENGIYAAAQRLTEIIFYVPTAVMTAANPILLRSHGADRAAYARRLQRVFSLLGLLALGIAAAVSLAAGPVVRLLFGQRFAASAPVLAVQVWACPALFLGVAQTNWFIAEERQQGLMVRSLAAAVLSVGLNLWLVPWLGARGASVSMVLSQTLALVGLNAFFPATRGLFRMQCRALVPWPARAAGAPR
jgi:polysaccharide transporter, PST family